MPHTQHLLNWKNLGCYISPIQVISATPMLFSLLLKSYDRKVTGRLLTKNCYGIKKVNRIKEKYVLEEYNYIYVHGDSNGDKEN